MRHSSNSNMVKDRKRWLFLIAAGVISVLLLAVAMGLALAHYARARASRYLSVVESLPIGTPYNIAVSQLRDANISAIPSGDCQHVCGFEYRIFSRLLVKSHLVAPIGLFGQLTFSDGKLCYKRTILGGGDYGGYASVSESTSTISRIQRQQYLILVDLSPADFTGYRRRAYAFNLSCIASLRSCVTDELLPTAKELSTSN